MGKKFVISESEISEIRKMYGLVTEQKYMKKYDGSLLNHCGYRAIERFEETSGSTLGKSMGDDYFERKFKDYDDMISSNIESNIGLNVFNSFPEKLKMQIWSWMFNSTDASDGTLKWLAGLSHAMNMGKFKDDSDAQSYRLKVSKKGSVEYLNAISEIINFKGSWDQVYNRYLNVLDKQYVSTAINNKAQGSYDNSWKFRPTALQDYYNECSGGGSSTTTPSTSKNNSVVKQKTEKPVTQPEPKINTTTKIKEKITGKDLQEFLDNIRSKTVGLKIDFDSVNIDMDKRELTFSLDETQEPVKRLTFAVNLPDEKTCESCVRIGEKNNVPDDKRIKGKFENGTRIFELFALY
jgi:hypothetical protein